MFLLLFPRNAVDLHLFIASWHAKTWQSTGLVATGIWFVEQLVLALLTSATGAHRIAFWAHVGGFLGGIPLGFLANRLNLHTAALGSIRRRRWESFRDE